MSLVCSAFLAWKSDCTLIAPQFDTVLFGAPFVKRGQVDQGKRSERALLF